MSRQRKPWEEPIVYNEDRFVEPPRRDVGLSNLAELPRDNGEERDEREVEELLNRPDEEEERTYQCNDTTPINYRNGPHDEELGVEDRFDTPDPDPLNYDRGPADDEEFGIDDEDFEPLDDESESPDDL